MQKVFPFDDVIMFAIEDASCLSCVSLEGSKFTFLLHAKHITQWSFNVILKEKDVFFDNRGVDSACFQAISHEIDIIV